MCPFWTAAAGARMANLHPKGSRFLINGEPTDNRLALASIFSSWTDDSARAMENLILRALSVYGLLQAGIFLAFGLYRGLWRFASLPDLQRILLAAGLGAVAIPVVLVMLQLTSVVPRSVLILYPPVLIFLMAGSRFTYRIWKEHRLYSPLAALGEPVLILGAGEAGARLTKELAHSRQWRVVGLLDDDPGVKPMLHVFTSSKAPWWEITDNLPQHEKWVPGYAPKK